METPKEPTPPSVPAPAVAEVLDIDRSDLEYRRWLSQAVAKVHADANRSADTHLLSVPLPADWGVDLYLKDESTHPTGSLKHRLARSLFLYALCNGWIRPGRPVIEASSGSTAVSEAYFARLIGVPFVAVMARGTVRAKVELIEFQGGSCHLVDDASEVYETAARLALETGGHYMDQFTYAERATDWRGNNNIAESIFRQMAEERHPVPTWIVATAGTGGTSATLARYVRYAQATTGICVADPENSAFFPGWRDGDPSATTGTASRIEGIGRQRVEPSFVPGAIDRMMRVPDAASIAAVRVLERLLGRRAGASTGTGLWAAFRIISEMRERGEHGSVVGLLCDPGERYVEKYYSDSWLASEGIAIGPYVRRLDDFLRSGVLTGPESDRSS
jgi:cysteine synthase A